MPYQADIPQPTDQLSVSQDNLLQNFQSIYAAWNTNHVTFDDADQGKHKYVNFPVQGGAPALAADAGLYALAAGLFVHAPGSVTDYNITLRNFTAGASGYCYLPCGLLVKFGRATAAAGAVTVAFPGPAYTQIPFIFLTGMQSAAGGFSTYASIDNSLPTTAAHFRANLRYAQAAPINTAQNVMLPAVGPLQWLSIGI